MARSGKKLVLVQNVGEAWIDWEILSQDQNNFTSTIKWSFNIKFPATSYYSLSLAPLSDLKVSVNGETVYEDNGFHTHPNNTAHCVASGEVTIAHEADGSKGFYFEADFTVRELVDKYSNGVITETLIPINVVGWGVLDVITAPIFLFVSGKKKLGELNTFSIESQSNKPTHYSISYVCSSPSNVGMKKTGVICEKTTETTVYGTLPLSLAEVNPTGSQVKIVYTLIAYADDVLIMETTVTHNYDIPSSLAPKVDKITVEDVTGKYGEFGCYVKKHSIIKVTAQITKQANCGIRDVYLYIGDEQHYIGGFSNNYETSLTIESGEIPVTVAGNIEITFSITDSRNYTGTGSTQINVHDYEAPRISSLTANRCASLTDGTDKIDGGYVQVKFSAEVTDVNSRNSATYVVEYKKVSAAAYTAVELDSYAGALAIENGFFRFAADTASSYDIRLTVRDSLSETISLTSTSTAGVFWHWGADGNSMGIGKLAELPNGLDIGYVTRHAGGFVYPTLTAGVDLNSIKTPNTYIGENVSTARFANLPADLDTSEFSLEVIGISAKNIVKQRITELKKENGQTFERMCYKGTWGEWLNISNFGGKILWEGTTPIWDGEEIELSEAISKQKTGIYLVFEGVLLNNSGVPTGRASAYYSYHFIPKIHVELLNGKDVEFTFYDVESGEIQYKRVNVYDDRLVGCSECEDFERRMLIYVIGV